MRLRTFALAAALAAVTLAVCGNRSCVPLDPEEPEDGTVRLWVEHEVYPEEAQVPGIWQNRGAEPIWLPGCTTFTVERLDPVTGDWVDIGPTADCLWEGFAVKVEPGNDHEDGSPAWAIGTERLHGQFWTGCRDGQPLSQSECAGGPFDVWSRAFSTE